MSRRLSASQSAPGSAGPFPSLPSASLEPVPEAIQHLDARKRRLSLRPHRLSVSSAFSRVSDSSHHGHTHPRIKRRRGVDLDMSELAQEEECVMRTESATPSAVHVADRRHSQDDETRDIYEWAILYENQRGITVFSIPYYSKLSLLPSDPPPFTAPNEPSGHGRGKTRQRETLRAPAALADYQLPDPNWRWVSKFWMVDMRGDGEVQQDGYEYNWYFRTKGWRSSIGSFNAGGWVRRRRWVRLMMRPANVDLLSTLPSSNDTSVTASSSGGTNSSPLPLDELKEGVELEDDDTLIWRGDSEDWARVRNALRDFRSDGRRLEAWEGWLGLEQRALILHASERLGIGLNSGMKGRLDDWDMKYALDPASPVSRDLTPGTTGSSLPSPPSKETVLPVLRDNFEHILTTFIFPDSRAKFIELVRLAGFDDASIPALAKFNVHSDFWSLARTVSPLSSPRNPSGRSDSLPHIQ
ncbi:hypothetical protein BDV93DRAFT_521849 [Ceratobasidium sp. AG-I]|nr:hypothetical protein BDV93DRAFT_521849 [Ceratobasidium sp. AG-I]